MDRVPVERVKELQTTMMEFLSTRKPVLLDRIGKERSLSDDLKAELKTAIDDFEQTWKGTAAR
jgi:F0F1-type ATP synthase alpha subunit